MALVQLKIVVISVERWLLFALLIEELYARVKTTTQFTGDGDVGIQPMRG